jgi:uncharacterized protein (TIGR02217 family)
VSSVDYVELNRKFDRGAKGGPGFSNLVLVTASGREQRLAYWEMPRRQWTISYSPREPATFQELYAFFIARMGNLRGFLFFDPADNSSVVQGTETQHLTSQLTSNEFQLRKSYTSGGTTVYGKITKPVGTDQTNTAADPSNSTVRVFDPGGSEILSGWTVDATTGILSFSSSPGFAPLATFSHLYAARFDTPQFTGSIDEVTFMSWGAVPILEIHES